MSSETAAPTLMAETQINDPDPATSESLASDSQASPECKVCESWQQMIQGVLGAVMLIGALAMLHYYSPASVQGLPPDDLQKQVHELTAQVEQLQQEQAMPAVVLNRYRNSIGYITASIRLDFRMSVPPSAPEFPAQDFWLAMA